MHQLLQLRSTVQAASGHPCTVETFLGGGGQGEVYRALLDGKPLALKWYFPEQATPAQRQNLETLIRKGPPNRSIPLAAGTGDFGERARLRLSDAAARTALPRHRGPDEKAASNPRSAPSPPPACNWPKPSWNYTPRGCAIGISPSATSSSIPTPATSRSATTTTSPSTAKATAAFWALRASSLRKWCGAKPRPASKPTCSRWRCCCSTCSISITRWRARRKPRSNASICRR